MKNKIIVMIGLTILFSCFYVIKAEAATLNQLSNYSNTVVIQYNGSRYNIYSDSDSWQSHSSYYLLNNNHLTGIEIRSNYTCFITNWYSTFNPLLEPDSNLSLANTSASFDLTNSVFVTPYKGTLVSQGTNTGNIFNSYDDYLDSIAPTWWDNVKDAFMDFVGSDAMSAVISGDWLSYLDEVLFGGLWTFKVGEGEDELVEFYTVSATPSPSPSPTPTQIPVQVNIDPTTGNVTYNYYIDVSGTPVPTSSPINPNPPTGSGGGGGDGGLSEPVGVEDYYEPDDSLSLPNLRIFQFKLNLPGTETDIGVDSLDNNFEVMNGYLEDNAEAITTVSSFFQVIPSEWFLLLGAIACFPIIAAMIKSLLGG